MSFHYVAQGFDLLALTGWEVLAGNPLIPLFSAVALHVDSVGATGSFDSTRLPVFPDETMH